jgi:hypothetical protein
MITRARLEMDIRLDRVAKSLTTFFDTDLSGSYLGLTLTAKGHMDRFRSFLHAYHIEIHGFWPPSGFDSSFALRRSLYRSMYVEFRALYQHLVDMESTPSLRHNKSMVGGICTLQNIRAFDTRYKLETLPHPLPLLPSSPEPSGPLGFTLKKRRVEREARHAALLKSLINASNRDSELTRSRLVRRYNQFEKETILDDFDPFNHIEGRKVRWILIYAVFQILASVISAPKEVVDTQGLSYPLCCQRPRTMPWVIGSKNSSLPSSAASSIKTMNGVGKGLNGRMQELRPDVDYLTSQRNISSASLTTASLSTAETRSTSSATSSPATTTTSRTSRPPSLLRFLQKRKPSSTDPTTKSTSKSSARPKNVQFNEILVYGYGNGLNEAIDDTPKASIHPPNITPPVQQSSHTTPINNTLFIKAASSCPPVNSPSHSPLRTPSFFLPQQSFSPQLKPISLPSPIRPESPTVPLLTATASSSRDSSSSSAISRSTSNTSNSSHEESTDHHSIRSSDTATTAPTPTPIPKPPEPLNATPKRVCSAPNPATKPLGVAPRPQPGFTQPTAARSDKYLSLPSGTGSGRMAMPGAFLGSYSNCGSSSSSTSVNVIREEMEVG